VSLSQTHDIAVYVMFAFAGVTLLALMFVTAPYGRHARQGWGRSIANRIAWTLMESPSSIGFVLLFASGPNRTQIAPLVLLVLWESHYAYRGLIFPFRLPRDGKPVPLVIVAMAFTFNLLNIFVNATWVGYLGSYPATWLIDPRFI